MGMIEPRIATSISCLESEDLVDKAYEGLLATIRLVEKDKKDHGIILEVNSGERRKDYNVFLPLLDGIYIPGTERNYWCGYFDLPVDPPPESGCLIIAPTHPEFQFEYIAVKRVRRLPREILCQCRKPFLIYKTFRTFFFQNHKRPPFVEVSFFVIDAEGYAWTAFDKRKLRTSGFRLRWSLGRDTETAEHFGPGALSLLADRRYLWNVRTTEPIGYENILAKVDFGIEEEMIKSLLYARQSPRTAEGRLRPILHWVRSHKRRLRKGTDIDIKRYLRGVTSFDMDGMQFEITAPDKQTNGLPERVRDDSRRDLSRVPDAANEPRHAQ